MASLKWVGSKELNEFNTYPSVSARRASGWRHSAKGDDIRRPLRRDDGLRFAAVALQCLVRKIGVRVNLLDVVQVLQAVQQPEGL